MSDEINRDINGNGEQNTGIRSTAMRGRTHTRILHWHNVQVD